MRERMKVLIAYDGSDRGQVILTELQRARLPRRTGAAMLSETGLSVESVIRPGEPARVLAAEAQAWQADSLVVASRRLDSALKPFFLGRVSTAGVASAPCPVEVVR